MTSAGFFFRSALQNLRRGGQRNLVALLCVAFGVMSLVAMTTMAKSIEKMLVLEPVELIGADLTVDREGENSITAEQEASIQRLVDDGTVEKFTLIDYSTLTALRLEGSSELVMPTTGMGVDPSVYPLGGELLIKSPAGVDLEHLLKKPGDLIITTDLASTYHLSVGDPIALTDLSLGTPVSGRVTGIASDTPNHQGSKVYYSHETARLITGMERPANTLMINAADPDLVKEGLEKDGWRVFTADELAAMTAVREGSLAMGLNDIGLLGLLVGGIGIANTMQVLLRRRRKDVAVYKTLGYSGKQILSMFVLEASLLGLGGSLLGAGLGVGLSYMIIGLFSRLTTVLVRWSFSPVEALSGVVIGVLTTTIFAMWAIVATSRVRPIALLRNEALEASQLPIVQGLGLGLILGVPFLAIAVWVLKSFWVGLIVLFGSIIGLTLLGAGLLGLLRLTLKLLPMRNWPLGRISRNNLRQRSSSLVFAMVALFIGVIMLALGAVITDGGQRVIGALAKNPAGENLAVFTDPLHEEEVRAQLAADGFSEPTSGHLYRVSGIHTAGDKHDTYQPQLMGRSRPGSIVISGAEWGSRPDGVYTYNFYNVKPGTMLVITDLNGMEHQVEVVGSYSTAGNQASWPGTNESLLVSDELGSQIGTTANSQFYLNIPADQLTATSARLGKQITSASLLNMAEFQEHYIRVYQDLFTFIAVMAGLAILAGILLVANSVSLSMLDRRFEIGVLKSIGYSRWQVQWTQVVEYTLMSVIVSLSGLILIWAFLGLVALADQFLGALLMLQPSTAAIIAGCTIGLTLATVFFSTWKPCSRSPVFVLNDRE